MPLYTINVADGELTQYRDGSAVASFSSRVAKPAFRDHRVTYRNQAAFVGPKLKVWRAYQHLEAFDQSSHEFRFSEPAAYTYYQERTASGGIVTRVRVSRDVPIEFSALIGDVVHNLRAALEYIICDLIRQHQGYGHENGRFPISEPGKKPQVKSLPSISKRAAGLVFRLNRNRTWTRIMWMLHSLDVIDKHNRIVVMAGSVVNVNIRAGIDGLNLGDGPYLLDAGTPRKFKIISPLVDGIEIHTTEDGFHEELEIHPELVFGPTRVTDGELVGDTLYQMAVFVQRTIVMFERHVWERE